MEAFNKEEVFQMLQGFEENLQDPLNNLSEVPVALEEYLKYVAKTGDILYPWPSIKPFIKKKVELVLDQFHEAHPMPTQPQNPPFKYDELKREILGSLDNFSGAPFTIQRLCELVTVPTKHYKRTDKFMRGLEKNVLVVTYVDDPSPVNHAGERAHTPPKSIFSVDASYLFDGGAEGPSPSSSSSSSSSCLSSSSSSSSSTSTASSSSTEVTADEPTHYADPEPTTSGTSQVPQTIAPSSSASISSGDVPSGETPHYPEPEATTSGTSQVSQPIASSSSSSSSSSTGIAPDETARPAEPEATSSTSGSSSSQVSQSMASSSEILLPPINMPPQTPAPLQQLDSFATVFSSPPSTPLAVVSNMPPFEPTSSSSSSSSSGSSAESSPQPNSPPAGMFDGQEASIYNATEKPDESPQ